jgi:hypothetical protein
MTTQFFRSPPQRERLFVALFIAASVLLCAADSDVPARDSEKAMIALESLKIEADAAKLEAAAFVVAEHGDTAMVKSLIDYLKLETFRRRLDPQSEVLPGLRIQNVLFHLANRPDGESHLFSLLIDGEFAADAARESLIIRSFGKLPKPSDAVYSFLERNVDPESRNVMLALWALSDIRTERALAVFERFLTSTDFNVNRRGNAIKQFLYPLRNDPNVVDLYLRLIQHNVLQDASQRIVLDSLIETMFHYELPHRPGTPPPPKPSPRKEAPREALVKTLRFAEIVLVRDDLPAELRTAVEKACQQIEDILKQRESKSKRDNPGKSR